MRLRTAWKVSLILLAVLLVGSVYIGRSTTAGSVGSSDNAAAIAEAIDGLPVVGSVLLAAAHPDDENSVLLPYLARGLHLRTAYLSATRGDGGQNLLGNEQYEALGLLRTEELLAARRVDGAEQFFGQAYDFGFSKTAAETLQKWGHEEALGDFVRIIRKFRPDVVISRFSGTPADGHGNHQAAGILTREAFRAAADPKRFPEQVQEGLAPWQASRLFLNTFARGSTPPPPDTITIRLDRFNPVYGETYGEIGAQARSMHRSQGMGTAAPRGPQLATFRLEDFPAGAAKPQQNIFEGIDLTLNRFTTLAGGSPEVAARVHEIFETIQRAHEQISPYRPGLVLSALERGLHLLREMRSDIDRSNASEESKEQARYLLGLKESDFVRAIGLAGAVRVEALADKAEIVPGETLTVTVSGTVGAPALLKAGDVALKGPAGWNVERVPPPAAAPSTAPAAARVEDMETRRATFKVTVPPDARVSQPYWLVNKRTRDYFSPPRVSWIGAPENPALFQGTFQYSVSGDGTSEMIEQQSDAVYRHADRIYGEREEPLTVVPSLGVWIDPEVVVFPVGSSTTQALMVKVRNNRPAMMQGEVHLNLPPGWHSNPPKKTFELAGRGDELSIRLEVSPPGSAAKEKAEEHSVRAVAESGGQSYSTGYQVISYPHIQTRYWFQPAIAKLLRFDVKVAPDLRVGYVMGTGDSVPQALKLLGVAVEQLGPEDLAFGDLSRFDAIITGIRAYEVRKDLVANHSRLMEYVKNGGLMIVQYSRAAGNSQPLGPYPMAQASNTQQAGNPQQPGTAPQSATAQAAGSTRVSVEEAPVEILEPVDPFFQEPNRITEDDFKGWVQERGLYFMDTWAPEYRPLLSSNDPGEPPQKGGMLLASYGKGLYLYTAYVWSRQLPAGVPGAYRIFANMISLGKTAAAHPPQPSRSTARQR